MKKNYKFSFGILLIVILLSFLTRIEALSDEAKLSKLEQNALFSNQPGKEYLLDLTSVVGCNKSRVKYLGTVITHTGKRYKILTSLFVHKTGPDMCHGVSSIAFLFYITLSFGQTRYLNGMISPNSDTSFWYKYQAKQLEKLELPLLDTSSAKEYYRLWTNRQAIDIWQTPGGTFRGKLTTWTNEYVPTNEEPTNRSFIISKNLTDDTIKLIRTLLLTSNILTLPTDDSIEGWQKGFDGITYIIEQSSIGYYSFKTYWSPKAQDSLKEAKQVQDFIDSVFKLTNAQIVWKEFSKTIPYECYINGGPGVACKILAKRERKKYLKEREKYRQQKYLQKQGETM